MEYSQSIKNRDSAKAKDGELERNFLTGNRERENYAAIDYARRLETIQDPTGDTREILIEWEEVRIEDRRAETLLKIHILTNATRKLIGGEIE